jgi:hypothetical protein
MRKKQWRPSGPDRRGGGQDNAAALLYRQYRAVDMSDCEEEGEEKAKGVAFEIYANIHMPLAKLMKR